VQALERALGNNASAQLQQEPIPEGGLIFRKEWFPYWTTKNIPPVLDRVILSVDCTFKASKESDRVAFLVAAQRGVKLYAMHFEARQMGFVDTCKALDRLAKRWKPSVILVEDKANGSAVLDTFKDIAPGLVAYNPGNNSKEGRANGVTGYCQAGDFLLGEGVAGQDSFLAELLDFPRGKNDDYVDVLTQLLHWALGGARVVHGQVSLGDGMASFLGLR
jgi:phage terminase large subunit-like protein